jgi:hypothetical protein
MAGLPLLPLALCLPLRLLPAGDVGDRGGRPDADDVRADQPDAARPSRVAIWFAASFGVTFLSSLAEVISAALGMREVLDLVNSVTAALASSLLAALAIAEQMRLETEKRIAAQAELRARLRGDAGRPVHARPCTAAS